jgi:hypothetical protein
MCDQAGDGTAISLAWWSLWEISSAPSAAASRARTRTPTKRGLAARRKKQTENPAHAFENISVLTLRLSGAPSVAESAEKKHDDHDYQDEQPD